MTHTIKTPRLLAAGALVALVATGLSTLSAQQPRVHVNPVVAKLAAGGTVVGISTGDLSMENARTVAQADADFVRIDMEHTPMDFTALRDFMIGMTDKRTALRKGNAQPDVAPFARFAPYGRDQVQWVSKQALDLGLMGIAFNTIENVAQTLTAVTSMRYPPARTDKFKEPAGIRGIGSEWASWLWGVDNYRSHADLWPLNPEGDLLAVMMIETVEGIKNIDAIAKVPGVGVLWVAASSDLAASYGLPGNAPELEAARQTMLKACIANKVVCGINPTNAADAAKRVKEGWRYIEVGRIGGVTAGPAAMIDAVKKAQ